LALDSIPNAYKYPFAEWWIKKQYEYFTLDEVNCSNKINLFSCFKTYKNYQFMI